MKKIFSLCALVLTLNYSAAGVAVAKTVNEEGMESVAKIAISPSSDYTQKEQLVTLAQSGIKRYKGTGSSSTVKKSARSSEDVQKIVIKPTYSSLEQGVWENYTYPDSRFAK